MLVARNDRGSLIATPRPSSKRCSQHSIIEFLQLEGAGPLGYLIFHTAWLTQLSKAKFPSQTGSHHCQLLDAVDLQLGNASAAATRTRTKASDHLGDTGLPGWFRTWDLLI